MTCATRIFREGEVRLPELAARAQLSLAATSELVNDLVALGYLTRRPDPADGRAKLGRRLLADAGDIEDRWATLVGGKDFAQMCRTVQRLLDQLDPQEARR